ncbi:MAG: hypothetical protein WA851_09090 [Xanthobacteraceae bacterium]
MKHLDLLLFVFARRHDRGVRSAAGGLRYVPAERNTRLKSIKKARFATVRGRSGASLPINFRGAIAAPLNLGGYQKR